MRTSVVGRSLASSSGFIKVVYMRQFLKRDIAPGPCRRRDMRQDDKSPAYRKDYARTNPEKELTARNRTRLHEAANAMHAPCRSSAKIYGISTDTLDPVR